MKVKEKAHLAAIADGAKTFVSERPCKRGHVLRSTTGAKCIECGRERGRAWTAAHLEHERERLRQFKRDHAEEVRAVNAVYREKNRAALRKYNSDYEKANRAQVSARKKRRRAEDHERVKARDAAYRKREAERYRAHWAAWKELVRSSTPPGLPAGWDQSFYDDAREIGGEVDHIIPLRPCRDCGRQGLHEPGNLQVLSKSENSSKKQRCQPCWEVFKAAMEAAA